MLADVPFTTPFAARILIAVTAHGTVSRSVNLLAATATDGDAVLLPAMQAMLLHRLLRLSLITTLLVLLLLIPQMQRCLMQL